MPSNESKILYTGKLIGRNESYSAEVDKISDTITRLCHRLRNIKQSVNYNLKQLETYATDLISEDDMNSAKYTSQRIDQQINSVTYSTAKILETEVI